MQLSFNVREQSGTAPASGVVAAEAIVAPPSAAAAANIRSVFMISSFDGADRR